MPQDFTAAAMPKVVAAAETGWGLNSSTHKQFTKRPVTAFGLFSNLINRVTPVLVNRLEDCLQVEVWWPTPDTTTATGWVNSIQSEDCILPDSDGISIVSAPLAPNWSWKENFTVDTNTCGNAVEARDRILYNMRFKLAECTEQLNKTVLSLLETNRAVVPNTATTDIPDVTISGGNYVISDASYWSNKPDSAAIMGIVAAIAAENGFGDFIVIGGGSHAAAMINAAYAAMNDNERSYAAQFMGIDYYADLREYSAVAGTGSFFIVEKSVLAAWFPNSYGTTPIVDQSRQHYTTKFSVPLQHFGNFENDGGQGMETLSYMIDGRMEPIRVDVVAQVKCGSTDSFGKRQDQVNFEMICQAMLEMRPVLNSEHTGIIKVSRT